MPPTAWKVKMQGENTLPNTEISTHTTDVISPDKHSHLNCEEEAFSVPFVPYHCTFQNVPSVGTSCSVPDQPS